MSEIIYRMVSDVIENHSLDCKCQICTAFVNEENGSKGHAAACRAALDLLCGSSEAS